jgi:hypothetical protein
MGGFFCIDGKVFPQLVMNGDPAAVEVILAQLEDRLVAFRGLRHVHAHSKAFLLTAPDLSEVMTVPQIARAREASDVEWLEGRSAQLRVLEQALFCLEQLRIFQVFKHLVQMMWKQCREHWYPLLRFTAMNHFELEVLTCTGMCRTPFIQPSSKHYYAEGFNNIASYQICS